MGRKSLKLKLTEENRGKVCKVKGCTRNARCKGYCLRHYKLLVEKVKKQNVGNSH